MHRGSSVFAGVGGRCRIALLKCRTWKNKEEENLSHGDWREKHEKETRMWRREEEEKA